MIFVDTSALYAVLDRSDANHAAAKAQWSELLQGDDLLLVSNYVLIEMAALVQNRLGMEALRSLCDEVVPALAIHWVTEAEHTQATHAVLSANRRQLSLVDCSSFQVMRQRGLRTAFAFDPHFQEQGFELLPIRRRRR
jgi:predicted nucleic acid-binding protein